MTGVEVLQIIIGVPLIGILGLYTGFAIFKVIEAIVEAVKLICEKLSFRPYKRIRNYLTGKHTLFSTELYVCKDIACKYEQRYCCMSCGQRFECEAVCEDYKGPCEWRVKHGEDQR